MAEHKLTRQEALELITPVIDGEVDEAKRIAFLEYIEEDDAVRLKFKSAQRIKKLVSTRYQTVPAPESLRKRVRDFLMDPEVSEETKEAPDLDLETDSSIVEENKKEPPSFITFPSLPSSWKKKWAYAATASVMVLLMVFAVYIISIPGSPGYNVEEFAYKHFSTNKGAFIQPTIAASTLTDAELQLANNLGYSITIPPIQNSELKGIVLSEFIPDFRAPMLEYYDAGQNQYIYVFAFKINDLNRIKHLKRHPDAVKKCINPEDYYVRRINGMHVVSWKWNDIWYTAISNHDGNTLASMVSTLEYNVNGRN